MIKVTSNDNFVKKQIIELLFQKNIHVDMDHKYLSFVQMIVDVENSKKINLLINDKNYFFLLPMNFNDFYKNLLYLLSAINIQKGQINFYPFKEEVIYKDKSVKLKHIHHKIFVEAIRNPDGIDKTTLYQKIWPLDKEVSINKIDTHLTNLKNFLFDELGYKLNFKSSSQKLVLNFD